jgi:hypothetical protein
MLIARACMYINCPLFEQNDMTVKWLICNLEVTASILERDKESLRGLLVREVFQANSMAVKVHFCYLSAHCMVILLAREISQDLLQGGGQDVQR